ncbi:MAG TPA: hypothetical protein ENI77_04320 [Nitrospirae bacterium]|nr:hypothetical protein [Nitrospirota bacterium]
MKKSIWIVFVIVSGFMGFLLGYSVSSYTGIHKGGDFSMESAGYGEEEPGGSSDEAGVDSTPDNDALDYYDNMSQEDQK